MSNPIHLDTLAVIEAARAAHAYGLLTAQAPAENDRRCLYGHLGRVCALGAAMPNSLADVLEGDVGEIIEDEHVTCDIHEMVAIQKAHDAWANAFEPYRNLAETAFLRTLSEVGGRHG